MPDGTTPPTTDEQINAEVRLHEVVSAVSEVAHAGADAVLRPLGTSVTAPDPLASGGGAGGRYRLSLGELDALIARWTTLRHRIEESGRRIDRSVRAVGPAADDPVSRRFARELVSSLRNAHEHNSLMWRYAHSYVEKFTRAHAAYSGAEGDNTAALSGGAG